MTKIILISLVSLATIQLVHAEPILPRHQRPSPTTCKVVREFVAMVGEAEAEKIARVSGVTEERVIASRKCLIDR